MKQSTALAIIDDDRNLLNGLRHFFTKSGYTVYTAENGVSGLSIIQNHKPDLVICDINMPIMNGFQLIGELKKDSETNKLPFIFLTSNPSPKNELSGFQAGADDFVGKPFSPDLLLFRVESILRRSVRCEEEIEQTPIIDAEKNDKSPRIDHLTHLLNSLHDIANDINSNMPPQILLHKAINIFNSEFQADGVEIWVMNDHSQKFEFSVGFIANSTYSNLSETDKPIEKDGRIIESEFQNVWNAKLDHGFGQKIKIKIFNSKMSDPIIEPVFLQSFLSQISFILYRKYIFAQLEKIGKSYENTIEETLLSLSKAQELRDYESLNHCSRVADLAVKFSEYLGISGEERIQIRRGAYFHDIGKIGIPDHILQNPDSPHENEREVIKKHPLYGYDLLSQFDFLRIALNIPLYHHENWDGSGYPYGLKGEEIPLSARLFSIVDNWDAMTHQRGFRDKMEDADVLHYLQNESGKKFEPALVTAFIELIAQMER